MTSFSPTSMVFNHPNKILGLPEYYYRARTIDTSFSNNTPANQYQNLKKIQNTVRVYSSLYTANLASLNAYVQPTAITHGVCWNQMSDRPVPSVQKAVIPTGTNSSMNRRHTSVTSSRPGCQAPGGVGCDIKHNSYDRYLNRLKGKGPLRRGKIPDNFGNPIPFNVAVPVYGGKTTTTSIVSGCYCPIQNEAANTEQNKQVYNYPLLQPFPSATYSFSVGDYVYAIQIGDNYYTRALINEVLDGVYIIEFDNGTIQTVTNVNELLIYYPCNCNGTINSTIYQTGFLSNGQNGSSCLAPIFSQ